MSWLNCVLRTKTFLCKLFMDSNYKKGIVFNTGKMVCMKMIQSSFSNES